MFEFFNIIKYTVQNILHFINLVLVVLKKNI